MKDFKFLFEKYVLGDHDGYRDRQRYEKQVQKCVKSIHGKLFVDIGAHKLFYSNMLSKNFAKVIAFEPNRNLQNLEPAPNVSLLRMALSNQVGHTTFYCYDNHGADSLVKDFDYHVPERTGYAPPQYGPFPKIIDSFPVTVTTYDHVIRETADLVKIDVEGAEFQVLEGMNEHPPRNIVIELHDTRREKELRILMADRGYISFQLAPTHWLFELA